MKAIRVVLDTNVVVSAHLNGEGYERHALDLALTRRVQLVASEEILAEYLGVLSRPKFAIAPRPLARSVQMIRSVSKIVQPPYKLTVTHDPDDNRFLECAGAGRAEYLVTGNKRHFPKIWQQTLVVNAREFAEWITPVLRR